MRSNQEFLDQLKTPLARFYLADFHVHSVGSADVCIGDRYDRLPQEIRDRLPKLSKEPTDLAAYDASVKDKVPPAMFLAHLVARRNAVIESEGLSSTDNWAIIGITDHNVAEYGAALSQHAWETRLANRLIVFPGIELDVTFNIPETTDSTCSIHVLCSYPPCTKASDIRMAIHDASGVPWSFGETLTLSDLASFIQRLRTHGQYPAICVAAHVASRKGIQRESKKVILDNVTAEIARIEGALPDALPAESRELNIRLEELKKMLQARDGVDLNVLRIIGACGFDGLQVTDATDERHYRRLHRFREEHGRAIPIVCSDAHAPEDVFSCRGRIPFFKLTAPSSGTSQQALFAQVRDSALRFGETRTTWQSPGRVTHWIEGIEIIPDTESAAKFWNDARTDDTTPFVLPLSRNLNCFIGGRGSGKSAAIEAAAFLCAPAQFSLAAEAKRSPPDWYKRASATLDGCSVRLCWKTTANTGYGALPKRALFSTRYFDPKHAHRPVEYTDLDGRAVLDESIRPPKISILRVHEIEAAAQPEKLRALFDDLCGPEIHVLQSQIDTLRKDLDQERDKMVSKAGEINALTQTNSPLRQYALRTHQFDEVDKADIREKYQQLDMAEAVAVKLTAVDETFGELDASQTLQTLETDTKTFFDAARTALVTESGQAASGCEAAHALVSKTPGAPDAETQLTTALSIASQHFTQFGANLRAQGTNASEAVQSIREQMANEGLPTGGKDREAKKLALSESEQALEQYRTLVKEFDEFLMQRKNTHEKLVEQCKARTAIRKRTADQLTDTLARDLDENILQILVDAQPVADMAEYRTWLQQFFELAFARYKSHRTEAMLQREIQPATLRQFLLDPLCSLHTIKIDVERAEDGKISEDDARGVREKCCARIRVDLDWIGGEVPQVMRESLPVDVASGLWSFPFDEKNRSRLDSALRLDEVVFDDLPVIKLNDRPSDAASTLRPVHELSPGQRCSAILPILLLSGDAPVIIDQPEENLDNRLIRQVIVYILASMKLRRQVIIATHNPNLPVLGDCEQAIILQAVGQRESQVMATGDLEARDVTSYVTEIMEGGREAFQYRHSVYQTHWKGPVAEGLAK